MSARPRRAGTAWVALALALTALGCRRPPTALRVEVTSEVPGLRGVRVRIFHESDPRGARPISQLDYDLTQPGAPAYPITFNLVPSADPNAHIRVEVQGFQGAAPGLDDPGPGDVEASAMTWYVHEEIRVLRITLAAGCLGSPTRCNLGWTCVARDTCVPDGYNPRSLPRYGDPPPDAPPTDAATPDVVARDVTIPCTASASLAQLFSGTTVSNLVVATPQPPQHVDAMLPLVAAWLEQQPGSRRLRSWMVTADGQVPAHTATVTPDVDSFAATDDVSFTVIAVDNMNVVLWSRSSSGIRMISRLLFNGVVDQRPQTDSFALRPVPSDVVSGGLVAGYNRDARRLLVCFETPAMGVTGHASRCNTYDWDAGARDRAPTRLSTTDLPATASRLVAAARGTTGFEVFALQAPNDLVRYRVLDADLTVTETLTVATNLSGLIPTTVRAVYGPPPGAWIFGYATELSSMIQLHARAERPFDALAVDSEPAMRGAVPLDTSPLSLTVTESPTTNLALSYVDRGNVLHLLGGRASGGPSPEITRWPSVVLGAAGAFASPIATAAGAGNRFAVVTAPDTSTLGGEITARFHGAPCSTP